MIKKGYVGKFVKCGFLPASPQTWFSNLVETEGGGKCFSHNTTVAATDPREEKLQVMRRVVQLKESEITVCWHRFIGPIPYEMEMDVLQGPGPLEKPCPFTYGASCLLGKLDLEPDWRTLRFGLQCCLGLSLGLACLVFSVGCWSSCVSRRMNQESGWRESHSCILPVDVIRTLTLGCCYSSLQILFREARVKIECVFKTAAD